MCESFGKKKNRPDRFVSNLPRTDKIRGATLIRTRRESALTGIPTYSRPMTGVCRRKILGTVARKGNGSSLFPFAPRRNLFLRALSGPFDSLPQSVSSPPTLCMRTLCRYLRFNGLCYYSTAKTICQGILKKKFFGGVEKSAFRLKALEASSRMAGEVFRYTILL